MTNAAALIGALRRVLFSKPLVTAALLLVNTGCVLQVFSEIPAYEGYFAPAWKVLPLSAVVELTAVSLFALNVFASIMRAPEAQILGAAKAGGTSWARN